jgi:hypothetical protein
VRIANTRSVSSSAMRAQVRPRSSDPRIIECPVGWEPGGPGGVAEEAMTMRRVSAGSIAMAWMFTSRPLGYSGSSVVYTTSAWSPHPCSTVLRAGSGKTIPQVLPASSLRHNAPVPA